MVAKRKTLADITKYADGLIKRLEPGIEAILDGMTAEDPHVGAVFDCSDAEAMQIYDELGLTPGAVAPRVLRHGDPPLVQLRG